MALTRKLLQGMGLTEEQIETIITEHTTVTTVLKDKIDTLQKDSDALATTKKELEDLKKDISDNDWKGKYEKEHTDFDTYKKDVESKEAVGKIKSAYKKLLNECKVGDKHIDAVLKVTDFSNMKVGEDGNLENADKLKEAIATEWSGFITTTKKEPSGNPETPPGGDGSGNVSRAGQLAKQYYEEKYGKAKED